MAPKSVEEAPETVAEAAVAADDTKTEEADATGPFGAPLGPPPAASPFAAAAAAAAPTTNPFAPKAGVEPSFLKALRIFKDL